MQGAGSLFFSVPKMKKAHAGRVPVLEQAFEIKLPWLMKQAKKMGTNTLVITDGEIRTVVELTPTRLATKLGGVVWVVDIVPVSCLGGRVRPLLKCPRAHEGNFQALYFRAGILACRHCHELRYRSNLAANQVERISQTRRRLVKKLGGTSSDSIPPRAVGTWRKRYKRLAIRLAAISSAHYCALKSQLRTAS
jgi:hypothetical protein